MTAEWGELIYDKLHPFIAKQIFSDFFGYQHTNVVIFVIGFFIQRVFQ